MDCKVCRAPGMCICEPVRYCANCDEPIGERETFVSTNGGALRFHCECMTRMVAGSVGHQLRKCSCYGGTEEDSPRMTHRQAAIAAAALFRASEA